MSRVFCSTILLALLFHIYVISQYLPLLLYLKIKGNQRRKRNRYGKRISLNHGRKFDQGYYYPERSVPYEEFSMSVKNDYNSKLSNQEEDLRYAYLHILIFANVDKTSTLRFSAINCEVHNKRNYLLQNKKLFFTDTTLTVVIMKVNQYYT